MTRLFTALVPPPDAVAHLTAALAPVRELLPQVRWTATALWHVTLCFHGDDADLDDEADRLDRVVADLPAPRVALRGVGAFPGILWVGVTSGDGALTRLAEAAGADLERYHPHLTVGRWRTGERVDRKFAAALSGYSGPAWTASEAVLVRSELREDRPRYSPARAVRLRTP